MKNLLRFFLMFLFSMIIYNGISQKHYILEIDRINNTKNFKLKEFVKGRPVETNIPKPSVKIGDIITVRMLNFNELLYGWDIEKKLEGKPESIISNILRNSDNFIGPFNLSPAMSQLTSLLKNPPAVNVSRGDEGQYSAENMHKRTVKYLEKVSSIENDIKSNFLDEGLSQQEIQAKLNEIDLKFSPSNLKDEFSGIRNDLDKVMDTSNNNWLLINKSLNSYNESNIDNLESTLTNIKGALQQVDFISEQTFSVGKDNYSNMIAGDDFEKYEIKINVYKRASPLVNSIDAREALIPYNSGNVTMKGDQLNQCFITDLSVNSKYKPYFGVAVSRILVPQNRYNYSIIYNSIQDSVAFSSISNGGSKTSVGLNLCFDILWRSKLFSMTGTVGYAFAFWNIYSSDGIKDAQKKGFVTTGLNFGLKKFRFVTLAMGSAWGEYQKLSNKYQSDKYYLNNLSVSEKNSSISKTIKPAFYFGISVNL